MAIFGCLGLFKLKTNPEFTRKSKKYAFFLFWLFYISPFGFLWFKDCICQSAGFCWLSTAAYCGWLQLFGKWAALWCSLHTATQLFVNTIIFQRKYFQRRYFQCKYCPRKYFPRKYFQRKYLQRKYFQCKYFQCKYFQSKYLTISLKPNIFATVEEMSGPLILPAHCNTIICQHNYFERKYFQQNYVQ